MKPAAGFTLVELVVALTLSAIVIAFGGMFLTAPLSLYETQARRAEVASAAAEAWPQIRDELRLALPNSVRARRNGSVVALEMLNTVDWVRYKGALGGTLLTAGTFRGITAPFSSTSHYLSVNNLGTGPADAYALSGSITAAGTSIAIVAGGLPGEQQVTIAPIPAFIADSPRHRVYLVSGPVSFLCDESAGTLRRYTNYSIATNHTARDTAGELLTAGASVLELARNIASCEFTASAGSSSATQVVTARIASTRNGATLQVVEQARLELLP
jgi:MSHA biogenesis protein MshO